MSIDFLSVLFTVHVLHLEKVDVPVYQIDLLPLFPLHLVLFVI